jgi:hypothetical protein
MSEPEDHPVDKLAVQRLRKRVEGFAVGLGLDFDAMQQIIERVVADMPFGADDGRLMEARRRLLFATE